MLIAPGVDQDAIKLLKDSGAEIIVPDINDIFQEEKLLEYASELDAVIARTETYSRDFIKKAKNLKIIARHGVGVDNVDLDTARAQGIYVTNAPKANINSVAELVLGLMISGARKITQASDQLRKGNFNYRNESIGFELKDKTLGIIGYGNIGKLVAEKSYYGFGMEILVYDPFIKEGDTPNYVRIAKDIEHLLREAHVVSIHIPYNPRTHYLIDRSELEIMKHNAILINASRGGIVNEQSLLEALDDGKIFAACLDVFESEPPEKNDPLFSNERTTVTPHLGAQTIEAYKSMALTNAQAIIDVMNHRKPKNIVVGPSK